MPEMNIYDHHYHQNFTTVNSSDALSVEIYPKYSNNSWRKPYDTYTIGKVQAGMVLRDDTTGYPNYTLQSNVLKTHINDS